MWGLATWPSMGRCAPYCWELFLSSRNLMARWDEAARRFHLAQKRSQLGDATELHALRSWSPGIMSVRMFYVTEYLTSFDCIWCFGSTLKSIRRISILFGPDHYNSRYVTSKQYIIIFHKEEKIHFKEQRYCTKLGFLARFCPIIVQVTPLKTPFGLVTPFMTIPITRSYSHTQLLLTPLRGYTITILARSCLQSLIARLHCWLSTLCVDSWLSVFDSRARFVLFFRQLWLLSSPAGSLTLSLRRLARWLTLLSEIPVLKWACADGIVSTLSHGSFLHRHGLVTGETSVVYET
jgi:hypothetical protein